MMQILGPGMSWKSAYSVFLECTARTSFRWVRPMRDRRGRSTPVCGPVNTRISYTEHNQRHCGSFDASLTRASRGVSRVGAHRAGRMPLLDAAWT